MTTFFLDTPENDIGRAEFVALVRDTLRDDPEQCKRCRHHEGVGMCEAINKPHMIPHRRSRQILLIMRRDLDCPMFKPPFSWE